MKIDGNGQIGLFTWKFNDIPSQSNFDSSDGLWQYESNKLEIFICNIRFFWAAVRLENYAKGQ